MDRELFVIVKVALFVAIGILQAGSAYARDGHSCRTTSEDRVVDTSQVVTDEFLARMRDVGVSTVARYYDYDDETLPGKRIRLGEVSLIAQYGLNLVVVFQHYNNRRSTFESWQVRAPSDAKQALKMAGEIAQPSGSAIYFGVDGDFVSSRPSDPRFLNEKVLSYFRVINEEMARSGANFELGVYGSGAACKMLIDSGYAKFCWLSQSRAFQGTAEATQAQRYNLLQRLPENCGGRSVDFNIVHPSNRSFGEFSPSHIGR